MPRPVGIYVSVPFCKAKCTFCNFASAAFPIERMQAYVGRVLQEIAAVPRLAASLECEAPARADSVYLGGGTPSLLQPAQFLALFGSLRQQFVFAPDAEITLEAAPGQVGEALLQAALAAGVNRVSLGVQSFVDREARAVGRLHTGAMCRQEIARLRSSGVQCLSVDLIAGLPFQTFKSLQQSLEEVSEAGVEHVSVYMLETDGESRLGTEVERLRGTSQLTVLGEQARYHADAVPSDEHCAELYLQACETLEASGFAHYEISNFARAGAESRHNRKYWERAPYLGFGLDAHSMLFDTQERAIRFENGDDLEDYLAASEPSGKLRISKAEAFEEAVFLGLRLAEGISIANLASASSPVQMDAFIQRARELAGERLVHITGDRIALTSKGRILSSSVFGELLTVAA